MKSVPWPLAHAFHNSSNHLAIAVVVDMKSHRYSFASKRLNVVCKFLGRGCFEIKRAKATWLGITKAGRLQMYEIQAVVVVTALPRHFKTD